MELTRKNLMKTAWDISRELSGVYGGKASEYVSGVMKDLHAMLRGDKTKEETIAQYNTKPETLVKVHVATDPNEWATAILTVLGNMAEYWGNAGINTSRYTLTMQRGYQILLSQIKATGLTAFNRILQVEVSGELIYTHIMRELEKMNVYYDSSYAGNVEDMTANVTAWIERGMRAIGVGTAGVASTKRKIGDINSIADNDKYQKTDLDYAKNMTRKTKQMSTDTDALLRDILG